MTDPHEVLGVPADATQDEITSAYHRLVRQYHPDTTATDADRFREVVTAYTALRNRPPNPPAPPKPPPAPTPTQTPAIRVGPTRYHGPPSHA